MPQITQKGEKMCKRLMRYNGFDAANYRNVAERCSLIGRLAATYTRIQEMWCSVEMNERQTILLEEREARIEGRIRKYWNETNIPLRLEFQGDPRGWTVRILDDRDEAIAGF